MSAPAATRRPSRRPQGPNLVLIGAIAVTVLLIQVVVAYNASRQLPFVPTYNISVEVPDAAELSPQDEVRIGGARVGQVEKVSAVSGPGGRPFARLQLALDRDQQPLALDSRVEVRTRSLLGAKYLSLSPGRDVKGVPQGGTLPLARADAGFELDDAFRIFDAKTTKGIRGAVGGLGGALTGRGRDLNRLFEVGAQLLPPLQRTLDDLAAPSTRLGGFIHGAATFTRALEPVAPQLASLIGQAGATLDAVDRAGPALSATLARLPATETATTRALRKSLGVLDDTRALLADVRPGTRQLPRVAPHLATALEVAPAALRPQAGAPATVRLLGSALARLAARRGSLTGALRELTSAVVSLQPTLATFLAAQVTCNTLALWGRNLSSAVSQGDAAGNWFRGLSVISLQDAAQAAKPAATLNANPAPHINSQECEAGTEPYVSGGAHIGNPPGLQSTNVELTAPPQDVTARATRAGLLRRPPGVGGR
jgi:virulence factor Mce-like protein